MKMGVIGYIEKDGKVLMLYRNRKEKDMHEGKWVAPGGRIEHNESPYQCLVREIREETGLEVIRAELKVLLTFPEDPTGPFGDLWYGFAFRVTEYSGKVKSDCDEGDLKWIDIDALPDLPMWEGDVLFTPLIWKPGIHDVCLEYKSSRLTSHIITEI